MRFMYWEPGHQEISTAWATIQYRFLDTLQVRPRIQRSFRRLAYITHANEVFLNLIIRPFSFETASTTVPQLNANQYPLQDV